MQCPAGLSAGCTRESQGRQQNNGNGWDRGYFPCMLLQPLVPTGTDCPLSPAGAVTTKPQLTQGVGLARTRTDPRSCFWAALTKSAIMHTSFHIYAKSVHPTRISTVFEAL